MNKLIVALAAGFFAIGSYAQPHGPVHAPAAKHVKHGKKHVTHRPHHAVKHVKKAHAL